MSALRLALSLALGLLAYSIVQGSGIDRKASDVAPLFREPFLQRVSESSATVVWGSRNSASGLVKATAPDGTTTSAPSIVHLYSSAYTHLSADYYQHEATLTGLTPATTYFYDVLLDDVAVTPGTDRLTTAPATGTGTVRFIAFGDSGSGTRQQSDLAAVMAGQSDLGQWDFAIHTGDVVYPSATHQMLHDRFFKVYEPWLRRRPVFPSIGNHDDDAAHAQAYVDVFSLPENGASAAFPNHRERYYSFDYGPVHFVALDSQLAFNEPRRLQEQLAWLVRDLEATAQSWRIVFFHRPAYGSSDMTSSFDVRAALQPVFERYGVQLVLAGHEHTYARGVPMEPRSPTLAPVMHVVTGGGGAIVHQPVPGPWTAVWGGINHFLRVSVSDCTPSGTCELKLDAIGEDGAVFDEFRLPLRDQQRDSAAPDVTWIQPMADGMASGSVALEAAASDDTQVVKVEFWIDDALRKVNAAPPFEWSWNTADDLSGDHVLRIRATDLAGRQTWSEPRRLRVTNVKPTVRLLSPLAGEWVSTQTPYRIRWDAAAGTSPLQRFDLERSPDGGRTFYTIDGCSALLPEVRECVWTTPGPVTKSPVIRVRAYDTAGREGSFTSPVFTFKSSTPTLVLKRPDKPVDLGIGSRQSLLWSSTLGSFATLAVDLSRDGGVSWTSLSPAVLNLSQDLPWVVTGPPTTEGLIKVRALNSSTQDISTSMFRISDQRFAFTLPSGSTVWTANAQATIKWATNLGAYDRLNVRLSTDGGATFPIVLAGSVPATQSSVTITVPTVGTSSARLMVESLEDPAWRIISPAQFVIR